MATGRRGAPAGGGRLIHADLTAVARPLVSANAHRCPCSQLDGTIARMRPFAVIAIVPVVLVITGCSSAGATPHATVTRTVSVTPSPTPSSPPTLSLARQRAYLTWYHHGGLKHWTAVGKIVTRMGEALSDDDQPAARSDAQAIIVAVPKALKGPVPGRRGTVQGRATRH